MSVDIAKKNCENCAMKKLLEILVLGFLLSTNVAKTNEELSKIFYSGAKEKGKY